MLQERFGAKVRLRTIPTERSAWWRRRLGLGGIGRDVVGVLDAAAAIVEERVLWDRYGL